MRAFILCLLAIAVVAAIMDVAESCDCDYHPGGCVISKASKEGWKCKCRYKGAWTCDGLELQCDSKETCPGNCLSKECCGRAGGDSQGYSG